MSMSLEVKNLTKFYENNVALEDFNFCFRSGVYGILGANGAGKSTLFNLITDTISRDKGNILYSGKDIISLGHKFREKIGYMPQCQGYYGDMTAYEFMHYIGSLKGMSRKEIKEQTSTLLSMVGLSDVAYKKMGTFSGGMKQRTLLAQALLGNPEILILDEPTAGVDPQERIRIRSHIASLAENRIVLLATHIVSDIECIANQVLLMKKGKLLISGTPIELISTMEGKVAEKICIAEKTDIYQEQYGLGIFLQRKEGKVFRMIGNSFPDGFYVTNEGIGLEEVYLYYCV